MTSTGPSTIRLTMMATRSYKYGLSSLTWSWILTLPQQSWYDQFLTWVQQYRHLRMLKHAGIGMDTEAMASTKPGAYAVDCPACPHPSINLPDDWDKAPAETRYAVNQFSHIATCSLSCRWCYGLNLTIDTNFRLKNKDRHLDKDVSLGDGWGHWVKEEPYMTYLKVNTDEPEVCSNTLWSSPLKY